MSITDNELQLKTAEIAFQINTLQDINKVRSKLVELLERALDEEDVDKKDTLYEDVDEVSKVYRTLLKTM